MGALGDMCCRVMLVLALVHACIIFRLPLFLSILYFYFFIFKSGVEAPDRGGQWCRRLLPIFAGFFAGAVPNGLTFGLCLYVLCLRDVRVLYCARLVPDLNL